MRLFFSTITILLLSPMSWNHSARAGNKHEAQKEHAEHNDHGHHHGSGKAIGEGKAITEVDEQKGFKLSSEATEMLGLKSKPVSNSNFSVPKSALVMVNNTKGLYRRRRGFYEFIPVTDLKAGPDTIKVQSSQFQEGDEVIIKGLGLLRVTDVYSTDESEYGHAH